MKTWLLVILLFTLYFITLSLPSLLEGDGTAEEDWFIKPDSPVIIKEHPASIRLSGRTNLPDKTIISITFHYLAYEKKSLINIKKCQVKDGEYSLEFSGFKGPLPAGHYEFSIEFDPQRQYQEVKNLLGNKAKPIQESISHQLGTDEDIEKERQEMIAVIKEATRQLADLTTHLKDKFKASLDRKNFQPAEWEGCLSQWKDRLTRAIRPLADLDTLGVFNQVMAGKMQMEKFSQRWESLANLCDQALKEKERGSAESYEKIIKEFSKLQEDLRIDPDPCLREVANQLESLLDTIQKDLSPGKVISHDYLAEKKSLAQTLLLRLSGLVSANTYHPVTEISHEILMLFEYLSRKEPLDSLTIDRFISQKALISKYLSELLGDRE